jgi:hypothetical protein
MAELLDETFGQYLKIAGGCESSHRYRRDCGCVYAEQDAG